MPDNKPYSLKVKVVSSHSLPCRDDTNPHFRTRVRLCRAEALMLLLQQELPESWYLALVRGTGTAPMSHSRPHLTA